MSKTIINKVAVGGMDALTDAEYDTLLRMPSTTRALVNKVALSGFDGLSDSEFASLRDNTKVPMQPAKRQANLETRGNERAAQPGFEPTTGSMLFPRVSAASGVDTAQFAKPGLPQLIWAGAKDLGSLPGRTVAGAGTGAVSLFNVPDGDGSWLNRAGQTAAGEAARTMSAPTDLGNQGGVAGFLEAGIKDPTNALFPAVGAAAGQLAKLPIIARKLEVLKPLLKGTAGTEDAGLAADKITAKQADLLLKRRAAAGTDFANQDLKGMQFDVGDDADLFGSGGVGLDEGAEGRLPALEGYLAAAGRGAAEEVDPMLGKIRSGAHTPAKFRLMTPDWVAQKLGQARNFADNTHVDASAGVARRLGATAVDKGLPVLDATVKAAPMAGYSALDAGLSGDDREANIGSNLLFGGGLNLAGKGLKSWGTASFPGASSAVSTNRGPGKTVRQTVEKNMDELIGSGLLPTLSGKSYMVQAERKLKDLGKGYNTAAQEIAPSELVDPNEVIAVARRKLQEMHDFGANVYHGQGKLADSEFPGLTTGLPQIERQYRPVIQQGLDEGLQGMQGKQHIFASPTNLPEAPDPLTPAQLKALKPAERKAYKEQTAAAEQALEEYRRNYVEQVETPALSAKGLLDMRTVFNKPQNYQDLSGIASQDKKTAYTALHDASNEVLNKFRTLDGRTYGELLAENDLPRQYGLWSSFDDVLHSPRTGLQSRVSTTAPLIGPLLGNKALDNYWSPSLKYYAGRVIPKARGFGHALAQGLNDTTGAR